jgi:uncharacterized iron-regulated membrane protein
VKTQNVFFAPTLTYRPNSNFRFNLDFEYQNSSFVDNTLGIPAVGNRPAMIPVTRYLEQPALSVANPNQQERELIGYNWTYDFNNDWSLTNRFAFNNQKYRQFEGLVNTFDQTTGDMTLSVWDAQVKAQTIATNLDLNGKFQIGPFTNAVLLGTDYWNLKKDITAFFGYDPLDNPSVSSINIYAPVYNFTGYTTQPPNGYFPLREQWNGLYAQDVVSFVDDRIHLLFGGRYDWAHYGTGFSPTSEAEALGPVDPTTGNGFEKSVDQAFSPRLGAVVQPVSWLSIYANYTKSFGVTNALQVPGQPVFPPEQGVQYEAGVKAELLDKRLTATFAVYDIIKTNIVQALAGTPFSTPVGRAESKGVELDINGRINENWSVIASYSYDDARITNGQGPSNFDATVTLSENGNRLQDVPLNAGALWLKYSASGPWNGLSVGGGVVAVGERAGDNQNDYALPAYARIDSMIQYRWIPPGVTRALHGGWPVSPFGSWLLELGDSWAIAMIFTGFYLWWPRGRSLGEALWPRWRAGPRIIIRDLHATAAVLFSAVFLFFLISALPWTAFWGGQLLSRVQSALGQDSPAGFSNGGASTAEMISVADSIDEVIAAVRARGASGSLSVRLAPWPKAPLFVTNRSLSVVDDRTILGDTTSGRILGDFREQDFPLLARLVAMGVHVHQGDFGPINLWLNTAFALSLVWLSVTGIASWWIRRPKLQSGIPPKPHAAWPRSLIAIVGAMCLLLPIFAVSVLTVAMIDRLMRSVRLLLAASLRA